MVTPNPAGLILKLSVWAVGIIRRFSGAADALSLSGADCGSVLLLAGFTLVFLFTALGLGC